MDDDMEKQKEAEKDTDSVDGFLTRAADAPVNHRRAGDKRYHTLGNQKKKQRTPVDFATVSKGTSGGSKSRGALKQALFSQGASEKTSTQEERGTPAGGQGQVEALKQALESFSIPNELRWKWSQDDDTDVLEKSWTDIVDHSETMSKTQRHQQEALWELIHTEIIYINKLTIITDLLLAALEYVHQLGFLQEVRSEQLFSNLPFILTAHKLFWQEVIQPMLEDVRQTRRPFDPLKLDPGCLQFAQRFTAYLDYCWEEERNLEFTRRQLETNPQFTVFLMWVETRPQCGRMRLGDMQAKPHQRITKYPLLLKAILKTTEVHQTQQALQHMLRSVSEFLDSINDYLQFKDDESALFELSQRIEGYEMPGINEEIDKHMQELCRFDLTGPIRGVESPILRKLLLEETFKVRLRKDSKLEVVVMLFTDVLLLTKSQKKSEKQKVVHPPLSLERIRCAVLKDGYSFVLVEVSDLGCAVSVYSVSAPSPESCSLWVTTIQQAQEVLETLRKKETITPDELEELETFTSDRGAIIEDKEKKLEEMKDRETVVNGHQDESTGQINERRVTWNHVLLSPTDFNAISHGDLSAVSKSNGPHPLVLGELVEETITSQSSSSSLSMPTGTTDFVKNAKLRGSTSRNKDKGIKKKDSMNQLHESVTLQNSWDYETGEENEILSESSRFSRKLKSPRLRRKRPVNFQHSAPRQDSRRLIDETGIPHKSSSSNSDSDGSNSFRKSSISSSSGDTHLVLKLGSLKRNPGVFWNVPSNRLSADLQTFSDPELKDEMLDQNFLEVPKMKSHRSSSTPEVNYHNIPKNVPMPCPSPSRGPDPSPLHTSTLKGLLERAKERERERGTAKREGKPRANIAPPSLNRISVSTTPSPSPSLSEGERDTEKEVTEMFNPYEKGSPYQERECSVDGFYIERKNSPSTPLGASVDWPGWCFDDAEVLAFLGPRTDETPSETKANSSTRREEGECSEV